MYYKALYTLYITQFEVSFNKKKVCNQQKNILVKCRLITKFDEANME